MLISFQLQNRHPHVLQRHPRRAATEQGFTREIPFAPPHVQASLLAVPLPFSLPQNVNTDSSYLDYNEGTDGTDATDGDQGSTSDVFYGETLVAPPSNAKRNRKRKRKRRKKYRMRLYGLPQNYKVVTPTHYILVPRKLYNQPADNGFIGAFAPPVNQGGVKVQLKVPNSVKHLLVIVRNKQRPVGGRNEQPDYVTDQPT
jgi:hypothetical protein